MQHPLEALKGKNLGVLKHRSGTRWALTNMFRYLIFCLGDFGQETLGLFPCFNWAVWIMMSKWEKHVFFSLLNDDQMSNKVRVEHQPGTFQSCYYCLFVQKEAYSNLWPNPTRVKFNQLYLYISCYFRRHEIRIASSTNHVWSNVSNHDIFSVEPFFATCLG